MRLRYNTPVLWAAAAAGLAVSSAQAQTGAPPIDVVGLKLGMTVAEAKAQLEKYKQGIWTVVSYMTEDRGTWYSGVQPQMDAGNGRHPFHDAKIHIPVQIGAGYFEKTYSEKGHSIQVIDNQDTPIDRYSGDFFRLSFTPTDAGGKLYSIVRQRVYSQAGQLSVLAAAGVPLPKISDLQQGLVEKYGDSAVNANGRYALSSYWMYDQEGKKLANNHPDYSRCESRFNGEDGAVQRNPMMPRSSFVHNPLWITRKAGGSGPLTLREFAVAFQDREFYTLQYGDTKTFLDGTVNIFAHGIVPEIVTPNGLRTVDTNHQNQFRGCGTQLHVVVVPILDTSGAISDYASALTVSLSDLNAEFFDNGVQDYMKIQAAKVKVEPPSKKKEVF